MTAMLSAGAGDRLSFTMFLAVALHAILVLGITFEREKPKPAPHTMEITLSKYEDLEKNEEADFLGQTNQEGSGDMAEKAVMTTPKLAEVVAEKVSEVMAEPVVLPKPQRAVQEQAPRIIVERPVREKVVSDIRVVDAPDLFEPTPETTLLDRSLEIASLEARLDEQLQSYAKRPRVTRLTAASTMKTADAYYIKAWQEKIERVGNLNYPEEARRDKIYGSPRLLVALNPDGSVLKVKVLQSSGYKVLDDAAIRIVRLAAPFAPFPLTVRKDRDVLEIIRTFSFQRRGLSF